MTRPQAPNPLDGIYRTPHAGVVDADGHILEPPNLWQEYLEAKYLDRALIIETDDNDLERLSIGGKASTMSANGFPANGPPANGSPANGSPTNGSLSNQRSPTNGSLSLSLRRCCACGLPPPV